ncbi:MAG TPA: hypothetical protein ACFE0H_02910 [Elainellaceae cyanobacterium]
MKHVLVKSLSMLAIATAALSVEMPIARAQLEVGISAPIVANAGTLDRGNDHFLDVAVEGDRPLKRVQVVCVTFHELDNVTVTNAESGAEIPFSVDYGFENFTVTFDEAVEPGTEVRIVMENSRVGGRREGLTVPYRVFATYPSLGEPIPIGTALIALPDVMNR